MIWAGLPAAHRQGVKNYAEIASPLHNLTKNNVDFLGSEDAQRCFETLKVSLVECTALAFLMKDGGDYVLDMDASVFAIGAVLFQVHDGEERDLC